MRRWSWIGLYGAVVLVALAVVFTQANAQETSFLQSCHGYFRTSWLSEYDARPGFHRFGGHGGLLWNELYVGLGDSGLYADWLHSYSFHGSPNSDVGDEEDRAIGYKKRLEGLQLDFRYCYYDIYRVYTCGGRDNQSLGVKLSWLGCPLSVKPYWFTEYRWPVESGGPGEGFYHMLGATYDIDVGRAWLGRGERQIFSIDARLQGNSGALDLDTGVTHSIIAVNTSFDVGSFQFVPWAGLKILAGDQDGDPGDVDNRDRIWAGLSLLKNF